MKLLIRGGSIAAGHGVIKSYVDILKESLLKKGIEVINRSRYRETSFDGIGTFNEDIANFRPDILLSGKSRADDQVVAPAFQSGHLPGYFPHFR